MHRAGLVRLVRMGLVYLLVAAAAALGWLWHALPGEICLEPGQTLQLPRFAWVEPLRGRGSRNVASTRAVGSYQVTLALGGWLPVRTIRAVVTERPTVTVCGTPFGVKMFSEGALVVGFSDVNTAAGPENPAKAAGLRLGDRVIRIGSTATEDNDAVKQALEAAQGSAVEVVYVRSGEQRQTSLTPVWDASSAQWRAGMWVRDSSAGVGTMTFVDRQLGVFAGLGHPISDSDTGESVALRSGEIVACSIVGCTGGTIGSPGELKGKFLGTHALGSIGINGPNGVYGTPAHRAAGRNAGAGLCTGGGARRSGDLGHHRGRDAPGLQSAHREGERRRPPPEYDPAGDRSGTPGQNRRHRAGHERQPHPAERAAGGRGDPCAGQRPYPGLRHLCPDHAGTGTAGGKNRSRSLKNHCTRKISGWFDFLCQNLP